ncbi:MAG TPA: hypothetical protein VNC41_08845 [Acidimicrobiia bacterium]|nr:hypothetical protein [Acidimicrobiia bacterium]
MPGAATGRRFAISSASGGALATFVYCWMITNARWDFGHRQPFGTIHDAQARAWLDGRWDVPLADVGIEGFKIGGKYYTYYGPFLSVIRIPALLIAHVDGQLTIASMLIALVVLLVTASHLHWRVRSVLRPDRELGLGEAALVALFTFAIGAGSIVAFLSSRGLVYHEVELWGIAWAVATTDALVGFAIKPSRRGAIVAGVCTTGAMMTRISVGVAAVVALSLVALGQMLREQGRGHGLARFGPGSDSGSRSHVLALVAGVVIACALYAGVNVARFGSPTALPLDKQVFTEVDAQRRATLNANGGSLFGLKFAPTGALQYLRPDAIRFSSAFPWVEFPGRATVIGGVEYDTLDRSSSVPASMPGFTVLAIVGVLVLIRPGKAETTFDLARFWPPVIGGVIGTAFVLTIAYVAHRYLADFFPPLLFLAMIGAQRCLQLYERKPRRVWAVAVVAVFVVGAWFSWGLGRVYQGPAPDGPPRNEASAG